MSAQAGIWHFDSELVDKDVLRNFGTAMTPHAPDGEDVYWEQSMAMLYRSCHTTRESRSERQPYIFGRGYVLTWDGRLDNREELIAQIGATPSLLSASDASIVAATFLKWGTDTFSKLTGDWALSIWDSVDRELILAKDYLGTRHLYYQLTPGHIRWCSYLSPLVLLSGASLTLDDQYVAGYLASYPAAYLTPYKEIKAIPPGNYVIVQDGRAKHQRYWSFGAWRDVRYRREEEYEEHFRTVFRQAVRRRLRADGPILCELSGGVDSSSIVCVADDILARKEVGVPSLDTLSMYDATESAADERYYIAMIEERRGRKGHHFDINGYGNTASWDHKEFSSVPGPPQQMEGIRAAIFQLLVNRGYRVVLSGIGGDEFLGGVPNPYPQLADLIFFPRPYSLFKQLTAWSLSKRRPITELFWNALKLCNPLSRGRSTDAHLHAPWLEASFVRKYFPADRSAAITASSPPWQPTKHECWQTFAAMTCQFAFFRPNGLQFEERRYPYLDQDLLQFLAAIPADQLLRPGQRRSLMRRALAGLVPTEILWRKTKGSASRTFIANLNDHWTRLEAIFASPLVCRFGYVDQERWMAGLRDTKFGNVRNLMHIAKTLHLEFWLRMLTQQGIISSSNAES